MKSPSLPPVVIIQDSVKPRWANPIIYVDDPFGEELIPALLDDFTLEMPPGNISACRNSLRKYLQKLVRGWDLIINDRSERMKVSEVSNIAHTFLDGYNAGLKQVERRILSQLNN
jgi:hypothetical protein